MAKIIYFVDLHYGRKSSDGTLHQRDLSLHGERALDLVHAIHGYAGRNNIDIAVCGGDEANFTPEPGKHLERAQWISSHINRIPTSHVYRQIGNHEPLPHLNRLGLLSGEKVHNFGANKLVLLRPEIELNDEGKAIYSYDGGNAIKEANRQLIKKRSSNLILAGHWAFDRQQAEYPRLSHPHDKGYFYQDNLSQLFNFLCDAGKKEHHSIVSLHGHEHRFRMSQSGSYSCITMPAITQTYIPHDNDNNDYKGPCGLFVEITDETPDGSLRYNFKQVMLPHWSEPDYDAFDLEPKDVPLEYMRKYERPVMKAA